MKAVEVLKSACTRADEVISCRIGSSPAPIRPRLHLKHAIDKIAPTPDPCGSRRSTRHGRSDRSCGKANSIRSRLLEVLDIDAEIHRGAPSQRLRGGAQPVAVPRRCRAKPTSRDRRAQTGDGVQHIERDIPRILRESYRTEEPHASRIVE